MWVEFPRDKNIYVTEDQFMIGMEPQDHNRCVDSVCQYLLLLASTIFYQRQLV